MALNNNLLFKQNQAKHLLKQSKLMLLVRNVDYFTLKIALVFLHHHGPPPLKTGKSPFDEISPAFIEYYYIIETVVGFGKQSL